MTGTHNSQNNFKKQQSWRGLVIPDFKTYYKASVIETVCYWHKDRHIEQENRVKRPEIISYAYGQLIFNKGREFSGEE